MGLDGVQNFDDDTFGYGYIKTGKPLFNGEEPAEQVTATTSVTVPVGQVKKDPAEQPLTGLEVESDPTKTAVSPLTPATVTEPAANDPKYRVFAERTITDDASFKAAEDEALKGYQLMKSKGDLDLSDEEISKQAKLYAENVRNQENFDNTVVFYDKAEYKAAEAERQKAYDQLYEQYRNQGLSRKESKRKANNALVHNEYLGKRLFGNSARSFVTKNQDLFFENGKFSDKKYHDFVLGNANIATEEDEVDNYTYNLKERRAATEYLRTQGRSTTVTQQGRVAKEANMETERNNTALYRGLFFGGMIGVGIGTGALLGGISSTAAAGSVSASEAGAAAGTAAAAGATANAAAGATASAYISGELLGGVAGAGLGGGLLSLIRDKGNKIKHIKEIKDYTPVVPPTPPVVTTPVVTPPAEECPREIFTETEEYCPHKIVKQGRKTELWHTLIPSAYRHLDDSRLSWQESRSVWRELKRKNGVDLNDYNMPDVVNLYTTVNGQQYKVNCDAAPILNTIVIGRARQRYQQGNPIIDQTFCGQDCNKTYVFQSQAAAEEWKRTGVIPEGTTVRQ